MQGKYEDAASMFAKGNAVERIIEMWTDLRQFDKATKWAQTSGRSSAAVDALRVQQAEWSEEVKDYKAAAEMYLGSGQSERAVSLLCSNSQEWSYLLDVTRRLDRYDCASCWWDTHGSHSSTCISPECRLWQHYINVSGSGGSPESVKFS
jgi:intraflagellar transport protein 122